MVALHAVATSDSGGRPGPTRLSFEADDVDPLAAALRAAGTGDVTVCDEAYGRLSCRDPPGDRLVVDERMEDLYGYRILGGGKPPSPRVAPDRTGPNRWLPR